MILDRKNHESKPKLEFCHPPATFESANTDSTTTGQEMKNDEEFGLQTTLEGRNRRRTEESGGRRRRNSIAFLVDCNKLRDLGFWEMFGFFSRPVVYELSRVE